jgi:hypothetical protein
MGENTSSEAGEISLGTNYVSVCWVEKLCSQISQKKGNQFRTILSRFIKRNDSIKEPSLKK